MIGDSVSTTVVKLEAGDVFRLVDPVAMFSRSPDYGKDLMLVVRVRDRNDHLMSMQCLCLTTGELRLRVLISERAAIVEGSCKS